MAAKVVTTVREESGIALVLTILLLLMVSAIGLSALNRANDEKTGSTASRRVVSNLAAAEAGMRIVQKQLESGGGVAAPSIAKLDEKDLFLDPSSAGINVRSGTIGNPVAQELQKVGTIKDDTPGQELREGAGGRSARFIYRVHVTAESPDRGSSEIEAQFSVKMNPGTY